MLNILSKFDGVDFRKTICQRPSPIRLLKSSGPQGSTLESGSKELLIVAKLERLDFNF